MALTTEVRAGIKFQQTGSNDVGTPRFDSEVQALIQLASGTGANQADILFVDERTVATASNDDIDLVGVLTNAFGATITAAELVALLVINKPKLASAAANTTNLTLGGSSAPLTGFLGGTTPTIGPLTPGAVVLLAAPGAAGLGAVTATTADLLRVSNSSGASATYQIVIIARTTA